MDVDVSETENGHESMVRKNTNTNQRGQDSNSSDKREIDGSETENVHESDTESNEATKKPRVRKKRRSQRSIRNACIWCPNNASTQDQLCNECDNAYKRCVTDGCQGHIKRPCHWNRLYCDFCKNVTPKSAGVFDIQMREFDSYEMLLVYGHNFGTFLKGKGIFDKFAQSKSILLFRLGTDTDLETLRKTSNKMKNIKLAVVVVHEYVAYGGQKCEMIQITDKPDTIVKKQNIIDALSSDQHRHVLVAVFISCRKISMDSDVVKMQRLPQMILIETININMPLDSIILCLSASDFWRLDLNASQWCLRWIHLVFFLWKNGIVVLVYPFGMGTRALMTVSGQQTTADITKLSDKFQQTCTWLLTQITQSNAKPEQFSVKNLYDYIAIEMCRILSTKKTNEMCDQLWIEMNKCGCITGYEVMKLWNTCVANTRIKGFGQKRVCSGKFWIYSDIFLRCIVWDTVYRTHRQNENRMLQKIYMVLGQEGSDIQLNDAFEIRGYQMIFLNDNISTGITHQFRTPIKSDEPMLKKRKIK